jgi:hypothetical protein
MLLCGCFSYVPAQLETVPPGQDVRVYLTRQGLAELPEMPDQSEPFVTGTLVRREEQRVFMRVPVARIQQGFYQSEVGQDISFPAVEIVQLQQRKLNPVGTGFLIAGTAAATTALVFVIMDAFRGEDPDDPPVVDEIRIPFFSLPVR